MKNKNKVKFSNLEGLVWDLANKHIIATEGINESLGTSYAAYNS